MCVSVTQDTATAGLGAAAGAAAGATGRASSEELEEQAFRALQCRQTKKKQARAAAKATEVAKTEAKGTKRKVAGAETPPTMPTVLKSKASYRGGTVSRKTAKLFHIHMPRAVSADGKEHDIDRVINEGGAKASFAACLKKIDELC